MTGWLHSAQVEDEAVAFARHGRSEAEAELARRAADAIACCRLDEAIFWQRVQFRARLIRATGSRDGSAMSARDERAC